MQAGHASATSSLVAMARAIYDKAPRAYSATHDPIAQRLIPRNMARWSETFARAWNVPRVGYQALKVVSLGLFEQVALRTAAIDAVTIFAVQHGIKQIVILGAGLDARAFRLKGIEQTTVFELDHPATQQYKQRKTRDVAPLCRAHHFIPIDFSRDRLIDRLQSVGFVSGERTLWLMEGVSMYLPRAAMTDTMEQVSRASAPGSRFAITYFPPLAGVFGIPPVRLTLRRIMERMKEPFLGIISSDELHGLLDRYDFSVMTDESPPQWARRYTPAVNPTLVLNLERLVVGEKR